MSSWKNPNPKTSPPIPAKKPEYFIPWPQGTFYGKKKLKRSATDQLLKKRLNELSNEPGELGDKLREWFPVGQPKEAPVDQPTKTTGPEPRRRKRTEERYNLQQQAVRALNEDLKRQVANEKANVRSLQHKLKQKDVELSALRRSIKHSEEKYRKQQLLSVNYQNELRGKLMDTEKKLKQIKVIVS